MNGLLNGDINDSYDLFILIGMCLGFVGDIFLGFRNLYPKQKNLFFVIGISFFTLGHIGYINAMFILFDSNIFYIVLFTIMLFLFAILFPMFTKVKFGKMIILCHVYSLISSIFVSLGIINTFSLRSIKGYILLMGIISFAISDLLLGYLYFSKLSPKKRKIIKRINIITYYIGQVVLSMSIFMQ